MRPSMGSVGDCFDNALAESFFATLVCELLERTRFRSQAGAQMAVFDLVEGFYNTDNTEVQHSIAVLLDISRLIA